MKQKATLRAGKFLGKTLIEAHPHLIITDLKGGSLYSIRASEVTTEYPPQSGLMGTLSHDEIRSLLNPPDGILIFNEDSYHVEEYDAMENAWVERRSK